MNEVQKFIDLETLANGAFAEKLNKAIKEVAENIQDPNTEPTAKRSITVNIKFSPNKNRHMVGVSIAATTKLAATEAVGTVMFMGTNMRTGQVEISEWIDDLAGQMTVDDMVQPAEELPEVQEPAPAPVQEPVQTAGKPLDLRNRNRKPEPEQEAATDNVVNINDKAVQA